MPRIFTRAKVTTGAKVQQDPNLNHKKCLNLKKSEHSNIQQDIPIYKHNLILLPTKYSYYSEIAGLKEILRRYLF